MRKFVRLFVVFALLVPVGSFAGAAPQKKDKKEKAAQACGVLPNCAKKGSPCKIGGKPGSCDGECNCVAKVPVPKTKK